MNNYKYNMDSNYKSCSKFHPRTNTPMANITLWKPNNRLSYLRSLNFLEKFFFDSVVKNIAITNRTGKNNNYSRFYFNLADNLNSFKLLKKKLPDPEISLQEQQYMISYNFYRFVIQVSISMTDHDNLMLLRQIIKNQDV